MAGLNDLVTNKELQATTMPGWYSTAQQNLVNQAVGATSPAIGDTAAQSAISAFGSGSPFAAGQNILQSIGSGAANPWLVSTDATGAQTVTPNVSTPLGGLFAAQQDYLGKMLPSIEAQRTAGSIAGGDFGSRMNISGVAAERGKAISDLAQKQMQAALQAQQYGVAAGAGLGQLGQEQVKSALETGKYQQNAPYAGSTNLANILQTVKPDQTITKSKELGGLNQIMGLLSLTGGGLNSLLGSTTMVNGQQVKLPGLIDQIKALYSGGTGQTPTVDYTTQIENPAQPGEEGYGWQYFNNGTVIDPYGNYYYNGNLVYSPDYSDISLDNYYQDSDFTLL